MGDTFCNVGIPR